MSWTVALLLPLLLAGEPKADVVFVCEHGSVKSLIAAEWFNRLAAERGLALRAVSRGIDVDASVPKGVADNLAADGFDVRAFKPRSVRPEEVSGATRVVSFGVKVPGATGEVATWTGVPPASERYGEARDEIRKRVEALLDELQKKAP